MRAIASTVQAEAIFFEVTVHLLLTYNKIVSRQVTNQKGRALNIKYKGLKFNFCLFLFFGISLI